MYIASIVTYRDSPADVAIEIVKYVACCACL